MHIWRTLRSVFLLVYLQQCITGRSNLKLVLCELLV